MSLRFTLDGAPVEAAPGETVLSVARRTGVEIPTLCFYEALPASQSCSVCLVEVEGSRALRPSCSLIAQPGMVVHTATPALQQSRRIALELILSEHNAECLAPCELGCPAGWDIAEFMAGVGHGAEARRHARLGLAIPAVLGYVCSAPCEKACRRKDLDETVSIRELHRFVGEEALAETPECAADTGHSVGVVGAGPAGLATAFALRRQGHACTVYFRGERPGGSLREAPELPPAVLDEEIALIERMGVRFVGGAEAEVETLRAEHGAVVLAMGLAEASRGRKAHRQTRTLEPGLFVAGAMGGRGRLAVRAVADGFAAAVSVDQHLRGQPVEGDPRAILSRYGALDEESAQRLLETHRNPAGRRAALEGRAEARAEADRCLGCGCREGAGCGLRELATRLGARPKAFSGSGRELAADTSHPQVVLEPHKCILCGNCVQVSEARGADPGLAIIGRGYTAHVGAAFGLPLRDAMDGPTALAAAAVCPTRALRPRVPGER